MAITDLIPWNWSERNVPVKRNEERDPVYALQHNMNRLFDDFFNEFKGLAPTGAMSTLEAFSPSVDLSENDKEFLVSAELPGLDENDIEVSLEKGALTLKGEKKAEQEKKGKNYYRVERSYGRFQRSIPLPTEIQEDKVEATFKNGVLTVTLPKTAEAQKNAKRIAVKSA